VLAAAVAKTSLIVLAVVVLVVVLILVARRNIATERVSRLLLMMDDTDESADDYYAFGTQSSLLVKPTVPVPILNHPSSGYFHYGSHGHRENEMKRPKLRGMVRD
jgi:hypothetical protein